MAVRRLSTQLAERGERDVFEGGFGVGTVHGFILAHIPPRAARVVWRHRVNG